MPKTPKVKFERAGRSNTYLKQTRTQYWATEYIDLRTEQRTSLRPLAKRIKKVGDYILGPSVLKTVQCDDFLTAFYVRVWLLDTVDSKVRRRFFKAVKDIVVAESKRWHSPGIR